MSEPQVGRSYYVVNVRHEKFLDTQGEGVGVWRRPDQDIKGTIAANTSKHAGNIRWQVMRCPHQEDTLYLLNVGHEKFLDTHGDTVSAWRHRLAGVEDTILQNTSKNAGNIRWKIIACPHQAGAYYILNVGHSKFLDAKGDHVSVWRNEATDVEGTISSNVSEFAGNIRWWFIECAAATDAGSQAGLRPPPLPAAGSADGMINASLPLLPRSFVPCADLDAVATGFVLMQFNVLADGLGQGQFGGRVAADALAFKHRQTLAVMEVQRVAPDILCMQEVNHFDSWQGELGKLGYDGIFMPKYDASYPRGSQNPPAYYQGQPTDGCALFLRRDRMQLKSHFTRRFADLTGDSSMSQVFIVATIQSLATAAHVVTVSLSHLKAGGGSSNAKLRSAQGAAWAKELRSIAGTTPLVLCGDMNEDMRSAPGGGVASLCTSLGLTSAYAQGLGRDPPYTAIDGSWRGCLDYILISKDLQPRRLWEVPDLPDGALPSPQYPSDHLALAAELRFI